MMVCRSSSRIKSGALWFAGALIFGAVWILVWAGGLHVERLRESARATLKPTGSAQLISMEPLPQMDGEQCAWTPASASAKLAAASWQSSGDSPSKPEAGLLSPAEAAKRLPIRNIHDPYPAFSSIAVDDKNNDVVMTDENLFQILVYDRLTNTPPQASMSEPKRVIAGRKTKIEFQCGLYIDPHDGDIYAVNNDTEDHLVIFSPHAHGDVAPDRELHTPHGTFGIAVDEHRKEMYLTVEHSNAVVVYNKMAKGQDFPLRTIQGNATRLADPHGIAVDDKRGLMFVTNYGALRTFPADSGAGRSGVQFPTRTDVPGSGRMVPSSINVYAITAKGNAAPLRVITGPKTRMDWPTGLAIDEKRGELYVANDMGNAILVFPMNAHGDVAPIRVLKGPKTDLKNPTGISLDVKNQELLVANFGNHTATVYKLPAGGDTPPLRKIRSGPTNKPALMIGNPGSVAYDSKRQEILVPN